VKWQVQLNFFDFGGDLLFLLLDFDRLAVSLGGADRETIELFSNRAAAKGALGFVEGREQEM
jgi:hypothetical protein